MTKSDLRHSVQVRPRVPGRTGLTRAALVAMLLISAGAIAPGGSAAAQATSTISGRVTRTDNGEPLPGAVVSIEPANVVTTADADGRFTLRGIANGPHTIRARWLSFRPVEQALTVSGAAQVDLALAPLATLLSDVVVITASRGDERLVDAPAAIVSVPPEVKREMSATAQLPRALASLVGIDVAQTGINEFNVNTRGFNSLLNRRVLVLQDGRDLSVSFLGSQEWTALAVPIEDFGRIEFVRGPGSALYGANAFSGVLNLTTPTPAEVRGTKMSVAGGELSGMRADLRHAGVSGSNRFGYKVNAGYTRSDSWTKSRTNLGDLSREYAGAIDTVRTKITPPFPGFELRPLNGQTKAQAADVPSAATGESDPVTSTYGSARADYYVGRATATAEAGTAVVQNEVFMSAIGRSQVLQASRPWARLAYTAPTYSVFATYSGRRSDKPQYSLASGGRLEESSGITHVEAQLNRRTSGGRLHYVLGTSARNTYLDSRGSFLAAADDKRNDQYYSIYGELDVPATDALRLVAAARWDDGSLFSAQFSPRAAAQYSLSRDQTVRLTFGRAFQTPNTLQYLLSVPAGAPGNFTALENGLRASPIGPALAAVPQGQLFTNSAAVPTLALGNRQLNVESVTNVEVGYKGLLANMFVTVDVYAGRLTDFVTELTPGTNASYAAWTAPQQVAAGSRASVEAAVRSALSAASPLAAAGLTRLADGSSAIVLSYGNAGRASERGIEISATRNLSAWITAEANYSWFSTDIESASLAPGQRLLPNTPKSKGNINVSWQRRRMDGRIGVRMVEAFDWASGTFIGRVPALQTVDLTVGYDWAPGLRVQAVATNLFDQQRYQMFGGSLVGRRALLGVTKQF